MVLDPNTTAVLNQFGYDAAAIESMLSWAIALTILSVLAAIPTVVVAKRKGRSRVLWLVLALSIPVVPLLVVWLLPKLPAAKPPAAQ